MEDNLVDQWRSMAARYVAHHEGVAHGKMMSADALTWRGKVFAFYSTKGGSIGLGCRLGRTFDIPSLGLTDWQHLAPFKTKPPMKDWIVVGYADRDKWSDIVQAALTVAQEQRK